MRRETLEEALLRLLNAGPDWGGNLIRRLEVENWRFGWLPAQARVYPALRGLVEDGWLREWSEPDATGRRGGRPRWMYARTGRRARVEETPDPSTAGAWRLCDA